ncbi:hypothetical protein N836_00420 [Leptolyngbya sp. Heron Island J]|uniref:DUF5063 domain-containing protein n=1 Tax=Leptolyngbya sp. Heron Island J TaxID=1385935 RepID=UPI0003B99713|nr:DUF5063 domain-containing protein [Leptolyngbya sp. Heron Island J]ESA36370.1 hypothetical protein N836_00420 [Leptolyngbya sp. Heron Island J]
MITQFIQLIHQYLYLLDGLPQANLTGREFLIECAILLPKIYSLSHKLPEVELPEDESIQEITVSIQAPTIAINRLLGEYDLYSEVFDPVVDTEAITTTISDDLSDIYLDLKRPLIKYKTGIAANQCIAIWEWRFNLQGHCGDHLVDVLRPIHRLVYNHLVAES